MPDTGSHPRAVFYVQHLLGIGHLARACRVAAAMAEDGWEVDLVVGGEMPAGLSAGSARLVHLPPVRAGAGTLSRLLHPDGSPFDAEAQERRRDQLLAHVAARRPQVLLIETFPFGRRQMRFELLPLLAQVSRGPEPPLIATSIRDILQEERRPERIDETLQVLDSFFDLVLVHGDPALVRLESSYPAARRFSDKIAYTGLVAPALTGEAHAPFDVVVSVGGGAVGEAMLRASLAARPLTRLADRRWLLLHGPNLPAAGRAALEAQAHGVTLMHFVPDLAGQLRTATLSISQAGYNTIADVLVAGCRAVLIPYAGSGETEQSLRASLLARAGRVVVVPEEELDAAALAAAIDCALDLPAGASPFNVQGARATSTILRRALALRR